MQRETDNNASKILKIEGKTYRNIKNVQKPAKLWL